MLWRFGWLGIAQHFSPSERVFPVKSSMLVFFNGHFVSEEQAVVSVFDRSFLYGDGLFETILVRNGKPFRWEQHLHRLRHGAEFLGLTLPFSADALRNFAGGLAAENRMRDALLRLTVSRGVGPRGYSPKGADRPAVVMSMHPLADAALEVSLACEARGGKHAFPEWNLVTSSVRLPAHEPLSQFKTCSKLPQILARAQADAAGADEALLLNTDGFVVEGSSSNLFWIEGDTVCTAPLPSGILAGVTRAVVLELCPALGLTTREAEIRPADLPGTDGVFVSLSSWGVVAAASLDGRALRKSPVIDRIRACYEELVRAETG